MAQNIQTLLAKLSPEEVAELVTQAQKTQSKASDADKRKAAYGEALVDMITQVIEGEDYAAPEGKDWAGYKVYGIPVEVAGHTFTVSVTVTDTQAKQAREQARKVAEARALLAAQEEEGDES